MKKLFIGVPIAIGIIAAAGAGVYFLLQKRNTTTTANNYSKQIVGVWRLDSIGTAGDTNNLNILTLLDSNLFKHKYEFGDDRRVLVSIGDSLTADSSRYSFINENTLVFQNDLFNKAPDSLNIKTLSDESMVLADRDSAELYFVKVK